MTLCYTYVERASPFIKQHEPASGYTSHPRAQSVERTALNRVVEGSSNIRSSSPRSVGCKLLAGEKVEEGEGQQGT